MGSAIPPSSPAAWPAAGPGRCLALGGRLYLMDEPFSGVDTDRARRILTRIRELHLPTILTCHDQALLPLADQVVELDGPPLKLICGDLS